MSNPLCKYCGKPMQIARIEYTDVYYKCSCADYMREQSLKREIMEIESDLDIKKRQLQEHINNNSSYHKSLRDLEGQIRDLKMLYYTEE